MLESSPVCRTDRIIRGFSFPSLDTSVPVCYVPTTSVDLPIGKSGFVVFRPGEKVINDFTSSTEVRFPNIDPSDIKANPEFEDIFFASPSVRLVIWKDHNNQTLHTHIEMPGEIEEGTSHMLTEICKNATKEEIEKAADLISQTIPDCELSDGEITFNFNGEKLMVLRQSDEVSENPDALTLDEKGVFHGSSPYPFDIYYDSKSNKFFIEFETRVINFKTASGIETQLTVISGLELKTLDCVEITNCAQQTVANLSSATDKQIRQIIKPYLRFEITAGKD